MNKRRRFKAKRRRAAEKWFRRFCGGYIAPRGFNAGCIAPYTVTTVCIGIDWGPAHHGDAYGSGELPPPCAPV